MESLKKIVFLAILSLLVFASSVNAATGTLIVSASKVRKEPNTTSDIETVIYEYDEVEILGEEGEWYNIKYNSYTGYVKKEFLKVSETSNNNTPSNEVASTTNTTENDSSNENNSQNLGSEILNENVVVESNTSLRILPSFMSKTIINVEAGKNFKKVAELNNWIQVTDDSVVGWLLKNKTNINGENVITEPDKTVDNKLEENANNVVNTENEKTNTVENTVKNEVKNEVTNEVTNNETNTTNNAITENNTGKTGKINVETARVRQNASSDSEIIDGLDYGSTVNILAEEGDWYKVKSGYIEGYVSKRLITITGTTSRSLQENRENLNNNTEDETTIDANQNNTVSAVLSAGTTSSSVQSNIVNFAKQYLGYPYVAAGKSPETGFDCSGFTRYVFLNFGVTLGGSAASQAGNGTEVARENIQPGDLLLFYDEGRTKIGHAGIYVGDGIFIHAANPSRGVVLDNLNTNSYYNTRFVTARRIL